VVVRVHGQAVLEFFEKNMEPKVRSLRTDIPLSDQGGLSLGSVHDRSEKLQRIVLDIIVAAQCGPAEVSHAYLQESELPQGKRASVVTRREQKVSLRACYRQRASGS
jgi:hypothetical protein